MIEQLTDFAVPNESVFALPTGAAGYNTGTLFDMGNEFRDKRNIGSAV